MRAHPARGAQKIGRAATVACSEVDDAVNSAPLGSVIIPAYNESAGIRRCLDALFAGIDPGRLDVVVVCNGCRDDTAALARDSGHPVRVIELAAPSKAAALRAGDAAARAMPRLYLDADVVLDGAAACAVLERLRAGALAARPAVRFDSTASTWPVRSYYRARARTPALLDSLWGAGVYGLSEQGRSRFTAFPDIVADDLWVDRLFAPGETEIVDDTRVVVMVPRRSRDLVNVLRRTYRGKRENAGADPYGRGRATTVAVVRQLRRHAGAGPAATLDAVTYAAFAAGARLVLKLPGERVRWDRDESSRAGA